MKKNFINKNSKDWLEDANGFVDRLKPYMPPLKTTEERWERKFSRKFTDNVLKDGYGNDLITDQAEPIMKFIRNLLSQERKKDRKKLIKKVEEILTETPLYKITSFDVKHMVISFLLSY